MLKLFAILPLLHVHLGDLDGSGAKLRAEQILDELGVHEVLTVTKLVDNDWSSKEPSWTVEFSTVKGPIYMGLNAHTGSVNRLVIRYLVHEVSGQNKPPTDAEIVLQKKILTILGFKSKFVYEGNVGWEGGTMRELSHGLPYFNLNPCYGPSLSMDPAAAIPSIYYSSPVLPPVNAWEPRLGAAFALDQLRNWGHTRAVERGLPEAVDPSAGDLEAELGYWKPKDSDTGLLVWRATKYLQVQGKRYGSGTLRMFVNALTGDFIEPDDPLWGPDP